MPEQVTIQTRVSTKGTYTGVSTKDQSLSNEDRFQYEKSQWQDIFWAILFYVHLFSFFVIGIWLAIGFFSKNSVTSKGTSMDTSKTSKFIIGLIVSLITSCGFSALWLHLIKTYNIHIILKIYIGIMGVITLGSIYFLRAGVIFPLLVFAITFFFYWQNRHRIPFADTILKASSQALQDQPGPIYLAFVIVFIEIVWTVVWFLILSMISSRFNLNYAIMFILILSFFWTSEVLRNVGHVTTAGSVAMWWIQHDSPSPTCGALKRALTTSFGSICLGSLMVALIKTIREILRQAKQAAYQSNNAGAACMIACADCLLSCIEGLVEYFNAYAYTYVAIYGTNFMTSAKNTMQLFKEKGFTALVNDNITSMVLNLGCILGGVVSAAIAALICWMFVGSSFIIGALLAGFFIGAIVCSLVMNVLQSAVITTFVVWADSPELLQQNRPEHYFKIKEAATSQDSNFSG